MDKEKELHIEAAKRYPKGGFFKCLLTHKTLESTGDFLVNAFGMGFVEVIPDDGTGSGVVYCDGKWAESIQGSCVYSATNELRYKARETDLGNGMAKVDYTIQQKWQGSDGSCEWRWIEYVG